jgi:hypothetical protein
MRLKASRVSWIVLIAAVALGEHVQVRVHYPSSITTLCNATMGIASAISNFVVEPMNRSIGDTDVWVSSLMYSDAHAGRLVSLTFSLLVSDTLPDSSPCWDFCPNAGAFHSTNLNET